jgi:polysaccharide export outer membrane protein
VDNTSHVLCSFDRRLTLRIDRNAANQEKKSTKTVTMKILLPIMATAIVVCGIPQVSVVLAAQPSDMIAEKAEKPEATKPGVADGAWSPVMTGERRPLYRVRSSDVLEIGFTFSPEYNQTVTVQPDGFIPLKGLEALYVQGMTVPDIRAALAVAYAPVLHDPEITLTLKEFDRPYFVAGGQVARPGKYELRGDTTVVEAVAIAGGFTLQAKHSQVVLFRRVSEELVEAKLLNLKQMLKARDLREDVHLRPGDLLFVPQNTMSKIRQFMPITDVGLHWNRGLY